MNGLLKLFVLYGLLLPCILSAKLAFEEQSLSYEAEVDQQKTIAIFRFINQGEEAIEILNLKASCGCTVPELQKRRYEPGEAGEINVTFNHQGKQGQVHNRVNVTTNETENNQYALSLNVTIPRLLSIKPRLLFWRRAESLEPKSLILEGFSKTIENIEVNQTNERFSLSTEALEPGKKYTVTAVPPAGSDIQQSRVVINVEFSEGIKRTYHAFLRIQ